MFISEYHHHYTEVPHLYEGINVTISALYCPQPQPVVWQWQIKVTFLQGQIIFKYRQLLWSPCRRMTMYLAGFLLFLQPYWV